MAHSTQKQSLLELPAEITREIHRCLHLNPRPIGHPSGGRESGDDFGWDEPRECNLNTSIFLVCKKMYNEGSVVLYSENTFAFRIWEDRGVSYAPFLKADHIKNSERRGVPIKRIKKYKILV
jgi:hypothetical protein